MKMVQNGQMPKDIKDIDDKPREPENLNIDSETRPAPAKVTLGLELGY